MVFSGQLLAQTIMASHLEAAGAKEVRSLHTVFARAGTYTKPLELVVEPMHAGRTWASDTVTAVQEGRLLARSLVLLNTVDPDLVRHGPAMPAAPPPGDLPDGPGQVFPGSEWRPAPGGGERGGVPVAMSWHRYGGPLSSPAESKAVLSWATCGDVIGVALRPHAERVRLSDAHRTLSTGVIAHTLHFLEPFDAGEWLLVVVEGTSAAAGRIYGTGSVFNEDGRLVAVFHQDSMAKSLDAPADPRRSL